MHASEHDLEPEGCVLFLKCPQESTLMDGFVQKYSRREMLKAFGLGSAAIFFGYDPLRSMLNDAAGFEPGAMAATLPACVVRPEQTEGPYFVDEKLNRSHIRTDSSDKSTAVTEAPARAKFIVSVPIPQPTSSTFFPLQRSN